MSYESSKLMNLEDGQELLKAIDERKADKEDVFAYSYSKEETDEKCADRIYGEVTDQTVASFPDGADGVAVKRLSVSVDPVQDLHGYDNPWPAGGGKNKLDAESTFTNPTTSLVTITLTLKPNTQYTASTNHPIGSGTTAATLLADMTETLSTGACGFWNGTSRTKTTDENGQLRIAYRLVDSETAATFLAYNYQLEEGSTATSYAPYSNICPISGFTGANVTRTGKNLLELSLTKLKANNTTGTWNENAYTLSGITYTVESDSSNKVSGIKVNGTATENSNFMFFSLNMIDGETYTLNGCPSGGGNNSYAVMHQVRASIIDSGNGITFTKTNAFNNGFRIRINSGTTIDKMFYPMLRFASDINATYEPYAGQVYPITFPQAAGTVYGGTLTVEQDGTGTLVVDHGVKAFDGTETLWTDWSSNQYALVYAFTNSDNAIFEHTAYTEMPSLDNIRCSHLKNNTRSNVWDGNYGIAVHSNKSFAVCSGENTTSLSGWKSYLAAQNSAGTPFTVMFSLQTPTTYSITAEQITTLLGINNLFADTGDVKELIYPADTRLYIEKLTQPKEDDMTANTLIPSGQFFMIGNSLYYSTAQIAAGATINPGTNCTALSLADALNNLNT